MEVIRDDVIAGETITYAIRKRLGLSTNGCRKYADYGFKKLLPGESLDLILENVPEWRRFEHCFNQYKSDKKVNITKKKKELEDGRYFVTITRHFDEEKK